MGGCCGKQCIEKPHVNNYGSHEQHRQQQSTRESRYEYQPSSTLHQTRAFPSQNNFTSHQSQTPVHQTRSYTYQPQTIPQQHQQLRAQHNIAKRESTTQAPRSNVLVSQKPTDRRNRINQTHVDSAIHNATNATTRTTRLSESEKYLKQLQKMAEDFITNRKCIMIPILELYRNLPSETFDKIRRLQNGVMQPRLKDHNGDPKSPINGKIKGLFFMATHNKNGTTPDKSPFGDTRVIVPIEHFFTGENIHLYFTDFYCFGPNRPHYVTLVLTNIGSEADRFCSGKALKLNISDNPFITRNDWGVNCLAGGGLWVEIFYTHSVSLEAPGTDWEWKTVEVVGRQTNTKRKQKFPDCDICNI